MADHEAGTHRAEARIGLEPKSKKTSHAKYGKDERAKVHAEIQARKDALNRVKIAPKQISGDYSDKSIPEIKTKYRWEDQEPTG